PRQISLPTRRCSGSSSFNTSGRARISRASGWAPTGAGGGAPAHAAATSRQEVSSGRIAARIVRDSLSTGLVAKGLPSGSAFAAGPGRLGHGAPGTAGLARDAGFLGVLLVEQRGELFHHGAAQLVGVDDSDGAAVVAGDVVADADGDQLDRRARFDP